jgi:predicted Zn-dependent protease
VLGQTSLTLLTAGLYWPFAAVAIARYRIEAIEALAVLAHEIGHVVHRHGMRGLVLSLGLPSVAGTVLGDFSTVAASALGTVQGLRYSREAEREADLFARRCLLRVGVDPRVMATLWSKLAAESTRQGADAIPAWLSTHPGFDERLREAQQP